MERIKISYRCQHCKETIILAYETQSPENEILTIKSRNGLCPNCGQRTNIQNAKITFHPILKKCKSCAETVLFEAKKCKYCQEDLSDTIYINEVVECPSCKEYIFPETKEGCGGASLLIIFTILLIFCIICVITKAYIGVLLFLILILLFLISLPIIPHLGLFDTRKCPKCNYPLNKN